MQATTDNTSTDGFTQSVGHTPMLTQPGVALDLQSCERLKTTQYSTGRLTTTGWTPIETFSWTVIRSVAIQTSDVDVAELLECHRKECSRLSAVSEAVSSSSEDEPCSHLEHSAAAVASNIHLAMSLTSAPQDGSDIRHSNKMVALPLRNLPRPWSRSRTNPRQTPTLVEHRLTYLFVLTTPEHRDVQAKMTESDDGILATGPDEQNLAL